MMFSLEFGWEDLGAPGVKLKELATSLFLGRGLFLHSIYNKFHILLKQNINPAVLVLTS